MVGRGWIDVVLAVHAVAGLLLGRIEAEAARQQMVGEEAEKLLVVGDATELEIGKGLVRNRYAGGRQRGQLRVERSRCRAGR